jgi:hypothetical protein
MRRLLLLSGLASSALGLHIQFGFGAALVLELLAVWELSRAVGLLRREAD